MQTRIQQLHHQRLHLPRLKKQPNRFFSYINSRKCENIGVPPLKDNKGKVHTDDRRQKESKYT